MFTEEGQVSKTRMVRREKSPEPQKTSVPPEHKSTNPKKARCMTSYQSEKRGSDIVETKKGAMSCVRIGEHREGKASEKKRVLNI